MDFQDKFKIIQEVDDEARGLHPLLNHTFRHMEGVTAVEYTHGSGEKGADFIITKVDPTLTHKSEI